MDSETLPIPARPAGIPADRLVRRCTLADLPFTTTAELGAQAPVLGQSRAVEALRFGIGIGEDGYNLYAMGSEGVGRRTLVRHFLDEAAATRPVPADWCYVCNFEAPQRPVALSLPAGRGGAFRRDMATLVEDLRTAVPAAFEADDYRTRRQAIEKALGERQEHAIDAIGGRAKAQGIALLRTPGGFGFAPLDGEDVMAPEKYGQLPPAERKRIETDIEALQADLEQVIEEVPRWRRDAQQALRTLDRQTTRGAIDTQIRELTESYATLPAVVAYLHAVQEDLLDHAQYFRQSREAEAGGLFGLVSDGLEARNAPMRRYQVNLLVDHAAGTSAPIVYEDNPTHDNLVGRIEHVTQLGTLATDFTLVKPGALHRANGGYLIVDALKVLTQPLAFEALKRALRSREIRIEGLGHALGLVGTQTLEPEPIPLDAKVVLVGEPTLYYLLHAWDPEFGELFKVAADFENDIPRTPDAEAGYAHVVAAMAHKNRLRAFDRAAVARVVEHASRRTGSAERLSIEMSPLQEVMTEANYRCGSRGGDVVTAPDVDAAIAARLRRVDRLPERIRDEMLQERLLVATGGSRVGQANGLSVIELSGVTFGLPVRITARVHLGAGNVVDIEREAELGGPIHAKGVLILSSYLAAQYAPRRPLSLTASLVFEQTYGPVEGDSASLAELCALLSALAELPLSNALAITGSVNQHGDVQAIGAVNRKIEGFFDLCARRGLAGDQGVVIPAANVPQLMLREDVVAAVADGRFTVHAVRTVDEAMALLTGLPAGERDATGAFPAGSVNARIEERVSGLAERARAYAGAVAERGRRRRGLPA